MKKKFLVISSGLLILASACNNSSESTATTTDSTNMVATDSTATMMPTDTAAAVEAAPPVIDSAAVTREYMAAQKKTKKTTPPKPKKQGSNDVEMYSEEPIPSHEALEQQTAAAGTPKAAQATHTKEYVYFIPSEAAKYPGGSAALGQYISKTLIYPEDALKYHTEGTVYADVYLDSLGHVTNVEFPADRLGNGLEEETRSVLMGSPRWIPARENGIPVKSKVTVPVVYKIEH